MKRRILKWLCHLCWKIGDPGGVLWEAYYTARQVEIIRRRAEWEELA